MPGRLTVGADAPDQVNVVVEIPRGSNVKYEIDEETGYVFVDRFLYTPTYYPFNYGFIPETRGEDGDPLDALVVTEEPVFPMSVIRSRPIGVLMMEDEKGPDAKIIAVPARHVDPSYSEVDSIEQLPEFTRRQIEHFFRYYKESEPGKFVRIAGWKGRKHAMTLIVGALAPSSSPPASSSRPARRRPSRA
ncbi:MAG: inorganic diphosphatase [Nitrososphaerales archaeon]|jgi:inorganic pyrophosphatase